MQSSSHQYSIVLQGAQLTKAPSMTLSESQALDSFDFLGSEDTSLLHRISRASFSEGSEGSSAPPPRPLAVGAGTAPPPRGPHGPPPTRQPPARPDFVVKRGG